MNEVSLASAHASPAGASSGLVAPPFGYPYLTRDPVTDPAIPAPSSTREGGEVRGVAKSHDRSVERDAYERHVDRVYRLALRMTGNPAMAEDLTQDVFVRAFDRIHQFRGDAELGTWLHRVAISVILNAVKKRQATATRELPLSAKELAPSNSGAVDMDVRDRVRAAVAQLPEDLRVVVLLYDVEGYTHNEIADMMGINAGACRMRLLRARQLLRTMLPLEREMWEGRP